MSEAMVRDPSVVVAVLAEIQGEYRVAPATRNMLLIIAAMILPLLFLIIVRLSSNFLPAMTGMLMGGIPVFIIFLWLFDILFGVTRLDPDGMERSSPWGWWRWRVPAGKIVALGTTMSGRGRYLLVETIEGKTYRLPFRAGFERVLPMLKSA